MSAILITGMSGAGKSTIAQVLARRGLASLDADGDPLLARSGDTREHLRRRLPGHQDRLRAFGAIPIDARQPLDQVVDAILSHTLASSAASQASKPSNQPAR